MILFLLTADSYTAPHAHQGICDGFIVCWDGSFYSDGSFYQDGSFQKVIMSMMSSLRRLASRRISCLESVAPIVGCSVRSFSSRPLQTPFPTVTHHAFVRSFSVSANGAPTEEKPPAEEVKEMSSEELVEELRKAITELESELNKSEEKCKELQDKLLRALAENENTRQRYRKEVGSRMTS